MLLLGKYQRSKDIDVIGWQYVHIIPICFYKISSILSIYVKWCMWISKVKLATSLPNARLDMILFAYCYLTECNVCVVYYMSVDHKDERGAYTYHHNNGILLALLML